MPRPRGRPRKPPSRSAATGATPVEFLTALMRDPLAELKFRIEAAKILLLTERQASVKLKRQRAAHEVAQGRFQPAPGPLRLVAITHSPEEDSNDAA